MQNNEIMVSVLCLAYNHEKYIAKCLQGFVMQKTNFNFEVIINDDASTDNTAAIIKEYENKYPEIIKPIYQVENQHSKKVKITQDIVMPLAKGKYVAFCEGDDYWIDEFKLQKQVDALEKNKECGMAVAITRCINEDGTLTKKIYPSNKDISGGVIPSEKFMSTVIDKYSFHTSSYMFRRDLLQEYYNINPQFRAVAKVGDEPMQLYFGYNSKVYFVNDEMSCYRQNSVSSWSKNVRGKAGGAIKHCERMIAMYSEFDKYSNNEYHDLCVQRIKKEEYRIEFLRGNYKTLVKKEYKQFFAKETHKSKFVIRMNIYCPKLFNWLLGIYKKVRRR